MSNLKKLMQRAAAGAAGGAALNVEEVFSTYLYEGTAPSSQTITNGIDLAGEGGLVWIKNRDYTYSGMIHDTVFTGVQNVLRPTTTSGLSFDADTLTSFNSDGFTVGADSEVNESGTGWSGHVSWTWRMAPKFFDIVTYSGTGAVQSIAHNLGSAPGCIITRKEGGTTADWCVYHRGANGGTSPEDYYLALNTTAAQNNSSSAWDSTAPTDTHFTVGTNTVANTSGETYVAYLFAHNDGDGGFGPNGDADIIKCGSYTSNASPDGPEVDLGFEPQCVIIKMASDVADWVMFDNMRGVATGGNDAVLYPNKSDAEGTFNNFLEFTSTGFKLTSTGDEVNTTSGNTYIYIAIRRGPMGIPESATDVFDVFTTTNAQPAGVYGSMGPVDLNVNKKTNQTYSWRVFDRLRNDYQLNFDTTNADNARDWVDFDEMTGININSTGASYLLSDSQVHYNWKRAPNYFDVVAYTGDGVAGRTVSHNLGVAPEMIWVKRRDDIDSWIVYHSGFNLDGDNAPETDYGVLDNGNHFDGTLWNDTAPTATEFTVGFQGAVNDTFNNNYIAYLFASLNGVSKVGSYTGNGSTQTIDCGFSSGARFVLIKRSDAGGYGSDWYVWDTERGIVAANDPHLSLNTTAAEVTTDDSIDPVSSGFAVNQNTATNINVSSASYIFYAIA